MAKKKQKEFTITLEFDCDDEPQISAIDTFIHTFLRVISYWILGFLIIGVIGIIF